MGKSGNKKDLLVGREVLGEKGVDYVEIDRGGGVTYHGPGQVVLYPIFDLRQFGKDLRKFIQRLGLVTRRTAERFSLDVEFHEEEKIGLWVSGKREKLCSIGLRVKRWITMHGVAFNVSLDEDKAGLIRPCGINDTRLVSISDLAEVEFDEAREVLLSEFETEFSG